MEWDRAERKMLQLLAGPWLLQPMFIVITLLKLIQDF